MGFPPVEPAAKPTNRPSPSRLPLLWRPGCPSPKVDASSIEMKLGTYWFVRMA
ncbi:MAG: hypothetical protein CM1200mP29_14380 [Verrucomicrobiota bacterium]|nr:MAG: hypothetical protein CM1200mP29_14380 [Verrucomicrobiota bacterium]